MSLTATVYDQTGKKVSTKKLPGDIFDVKVSPQLLALAVKTYLTNQRQGTKAAKTRGDVAYSTAKLWRQKGTGRARHGSRTAPIFVGGGKAHGPSGNQQYQQKLTKSMRRQALLGSLSYQNSQGKISLVTGLDQLAGKTKAAQQLISQIISQPDQKVLLILDQPNLQIMRSTRNLPNLTTTQANRLNVYEILNHQHLIINLEALNLLLSLYSAKVTSSNSKS